MGACGNVSAAIQSSCTKYFDFGSRDPGILLHFYLFQMSYWESTYEADKDY